MAASLGSGAVARRALAPALALLAVALPLGGWLWAHLALSAAHGPAPDRQLVLVELRGLRHLLPAHDLRRATGWNAVAIAGYGLGTAAAALAGRAAGRRSRLVGFGLFTAALVVVSGAVETVLLLVAAGEGGAAWYRAASAAAVVRWAALLPAALVVLTGVARAVRAALPERTATLAGTDFLEAPPIAPGDPGPVPDGPAETARWRRGYAAPSCVDGPAPAADGPAADGSAPAQADVTGIGLSGGGIRAASTALGVLQSVAFRTRVVEHADYLVSVSGGGYTSGAFAQFLTAAGAPGLSEEEAAERGRTAFLVGTPEEDHVRRHSSYLADTPALMVVALSVILWHLLLTLTLLFGAAVLVGVAVGVVYRAVPLAGFDASTWTSLEHGTGPAFPDLPQASFLALGVVVALATLLWLGGQAAAAHTHRRASRALTTLGRWTAVVAGSVAGLTVAVPAVVWGAAWFLHHTRSGGGHVIAPLAAVGFSYVASVGSLLWKNRGALTRAAGTAPGAVPAGFLQIVLVIGGNLVLGLGWLVLAGGMATVGLHALDTATLVALGVLALVVLVLGGLSDETTLSLHPFYRARLAGTFAVRRASGPGGSALARPYPPAERTRLSEYGRHAPGTRFPHIVFAASATLGGHRAPPGQNRVSYTFCSHWVGGPDVGWVRSHRLEELSPPRLRRDLTVQGAVALSGAAIAASAGGQGTAWYESLFVLTGARLGAWLPNPGYLIDRLKGGAAGVGLPRTRRLDYLLRELVGVHGPRAPLLQVTDGGFYDNLGLLELLRRGCTTIYCVDASGDTPPTASTLAQTLLVARRELGVEVDVPASTWNTYTAGSGAALDPLGPLESLSKRLARSGLIDVGFTYPPCGPAAGRQGRLVVAKASLWADLGYPLLTYAHGSAAFPYDSTADQFFDADRYIAYTELGRRLGDAIVAALDAPATPPVSGNGLPHTPTDPALIQESP